MDAGTHAQYIYDYFVQKHIKERLPPFIGRLVRCYTWQSRVEIEHYSIAYFDCVTAFKAL